ncbi:MAG: DUF5696 domain-containing protein [Clostridia bacterium]|nr:DUF5696 domain-containing protein [Clostridia bacterium]
MNFFAYDENGKQLEFTVSEKNGNKLLTLDKSLFSNSKKLRLLPELSMAHAGDEGYYVMPRNIGMRADFQVFFKDRPDAVTEYSKPIMSFYGIKKPGLCCIVRLERNYKFRYEILCRDGVYTVTPIVNFEKVDTDYPYDDIRIEIIELPESAGYPEMAAAERNIRLARKEISPLSEKCEAREVMEYQRQAPLIRIRMGWKQSPSPVKHQTPDNEPPMHVACTFADVRSIADSLKKQGVEKADLQLVGWSIGGHDGRFPQFFPVEERLGGETEMRKTIEYVKNLGYRISTHTIWVDSYEIADNFSWDNVATDKEGHYLQIGHYSSGYAYHVCPKKQWTNAIQSEPKIALMGENGLHFTDVISIIEPDSCHSPLHPCTTAEGIVYSQRLMHFNQVLYGGFCSEGAMDFAIPYLDYALYVTFGDGFGHNSYELADRYLPFWELVYHGILLYNPASPTINFTIKDPRDRLMFIMRGGLPSFYFYSRFRTGAKNWMGEDDLTLEALDESVAAVKEGMDIFEQIKDLQLKYMTDYIFAEDGIEIAVYEDGTRIIGNNSDEAREYDGHSLEAFGFIVERRS